MLSCGNSFLGTCSSARQSFSPMARKRRMARFVKDVAAEILPAVARNIVSYLLPQPDKAVALFTTYYRIDARFRCVISEQP